MRKKISCLFFYGWMSCHVAGNKSKTIFYKKEKHVLDASIFILQEDSNLIKSYVAAFGF